jgi:hypothetical protein
MSNSNVITNIITEEINKVLYENEKFNDTDIINPENIDLYREYDKLNAQLFDDKLPRVPMKWSNRKYSLGHVNAHINRASRESKINYLGMSNFHAMPYRVFKDTLAHEMIHVLLLINGKHDYGDNHGYNFHREANRINSMGLGYNITAHSNDKLGVSDSVKGREMIAIILKINNVNYIAVTSNKVYETEFSRVVNLFERLVNRGKYNEVDITIVKSSNPLLQKYKHLRNFNSGISYSPLSDDQLNSLLQDTILTKYEVRRDKPVVMTEETHDNNWEEVIIV